MNSKKIVALACIFSSSKTTIADEMRILEIFGVDQLL